MAVDIYYTDTDAAVCSISRMERKLCAKNNLLYEIAKLINVKDSYRSETSCTQYRAELEIIKKNGVLPVQMIPGAIVPFINLTK